MNENIYISPGNRRMDFPTFSLPSRVTCPGATDNCKEHCYAQKAEKTWKPVLPSRKRNFEETKKMFFSWDIISMIDKIKSKYIRIHESGDFYNQKYLDKWKYIAQMCPDKMFLVYTQMYDLDWKGIPDNVIIYWTVWPDTDITRVPNGLRAYVIDDGTSKIGNYPFKLDGKVCTKGKGSKLKCNGCMWCYLGKGDVVFKIH